jgi:hypothetical protein
MVASLGEQHFIHYFINKILEILKIFMDLAMVKRSGVLCQT